MRIFAVGGSCAGHTNFHSFLPTRYLPEVTDKVYLDIEIKSNENDDEAFTGRITLGLFGSVCPKAVANFVALAKCDKGIGDITGKPLCYRNSPIHRIVTDFGIQGGDFSHHDGTGGEAIFEGKRFFEDESFEVQPNRPGLLSMANSGRRNTNGSQFFISTVSTLWLDGKIVIFGYVLEGMDVVEAIENNAGTYSGRPMAKVMIVDSGVLPVEEADRKKVPVPSKSSLSL